MYDSRQFFKANTQKNKKKNKMIFCFNEKPKLYQTVNKNSYLSV